MLDLFAGSGALAIEAVSRGARKAVLVDHDAAAVACQRRNLAALGLGEDMVKPLRRDLSRGFGFLAEHAPFALVLADPPYRRGWPGRIMAPGVAALMRPEGRLVLETAADEEFPAAAPWRAVKRRAYGGTAVHIFSLEAT